ncbi:MAG: phosphoglucosamine mutase [Planctomycetota bacterium]
MTNRLFGTDGVRDIAGKGYLTPENILKTGRIIGFLMQQKPELFSRTGLSDDGLPKTILLARDTRSSGRMIESALSAGILSENIDIISAGIVPTPVCSFLTKKLNCGLGVMVSASHNPTEYNGIKFFDSCGYKIKDELENKIDTILNDNNYTYPKIKQIGRFSEKTDALNLYTNDIVTTVSKRFELKSMKIVLDCANGALSTVAPEIFKRLGADVISINAAPDGDNINKDSGALFPQFARNKLLDEKADIAFSFDGDGDRVITIDNTGCERDGDFIMAVCARHLKKAGKLAANTVVTTVMANLGLEISLKQENVSILRTKVGDRFVAEKMLNCGAVLGGEQSGHIMFLNDAPTGDAIWTALNLLHAIKNSNSTYAELCNCLTKCPQILINVKVHTKPPLMSIPDIKKAAENAEKELEKDGRVVLRYSGTEPLARVMIEGKNKEQIETLADNIATAIRTSIGESPKI